MIDESTQIKLRQQFNPDGSDLRNLQLRMLEMLKYIDTVCKEHHIKWWLSSGTCLGAVRHGGFIPWDDDVDIEMFKDDYKRLCRILKSGKNDRYILQDHTTDSEYTFKFVKLRDVQSVCLEPYYASKWFKLNGCYIDIFPIEPSASKTINRIASSLWIRGVKLLANITKKKPRKFMLAFNYRIMTFVMNILSCINAIGAEDNYRVACGCGFLAKRNKADMRDTVYVKFEDTLLPIPVDFDSYLTKLYGDYNRIPDTSSIHPHLNHIELL